MGTKMEVQTIFSEGELTPKRTNLVGEVELFGKKTKIVEVAIILFYLFSLSTACSKFLKFEEKVAVW